MMNKKMSYTAVKGDFPLKVIINEELLSSIVKKKKIIPYHVRMNITGNCNLTCAWCSRSKTDRRLELSYEEIISIIKKYLALGCNTVTISGSGEPLMHKDINKLITKIYYMGLDIGLITNGWFLKNLTDENLGFLTWIRVSLGDKRTQPKSYWDNLQKTIDRSTVDWSFSYILTRNPDYDLIKSMITFANKNNFTHIRLMSDLNIENNSWAEHILRNWLRQENVKTKLLIYQNNQYSKGSKNCLVGLLRPIVDTEGIIYPCCNTQFAINSPNDWIKTMSLGTVKDIETICEEQKIFDGSKCYKCYSNH